MFAREGLWPMCDASRGVKVLSEKTGSDNNIQNERSNSESILIIPAIWGAQELQIRFQLNIRSSFSLLTADDGYPKFRVWKRKRNMDNEVQASENDRQRGYEKVWDMVLNDYGKGWLVWKFVRCIAIRFGNQRRFFKSWSWWWLKSTVDRCTTMWF